MTRRAGFLSNRRTHSNENGGSGNVIPWYFVDASLWAFAVLLVVGKISLELRPNGGGCSLGCFTVVTEVNVVHAGSTCSSILAETIET